MNTQRIPTKIAFRPLIALIGLVALLTACTTSGTTETTSAETTATTTQTSDTVASPAPTDPEASADTTDPTSELSDVEITLRLGTIVKGALYWNIFAAEDLGYWEDENLVVDIVTVRGDSECIQAMEGGSLEVCPSNVDSLVRSVQAGASVRAIATIADPAAHSLLASPEITSFEDLRGADIAAQGQEEGSTVAILALLAANGLSRTDVDMIDVGGTTDRYAALSAGQVDAAILTQPADFLAIEEGFTLLGRSPSARPLTTVLVAIPERSPEIDEGLRRFVAAMQRSSAWLMDPNNRELAIEQLQRVFEVEEAIATSHYELYVEELEYLSDDITPSVSSVATSLDIVDEFTSTDVVTDAEDLIDTRYVATAGQ